MCSAQVFVFGAFIEYSVVNVLARKNKKKAKMQRERSRVFAGNSFTPVPTNGEEVTASSGRLISPILIPLYILT